MLATVFDLEKLKEDESRIKEELLKPEVYSNFSISSELSKKQNDLLKVISSYDDASKNLADLKELLGLVEGLVVGVLPTLLCQVTLVKSSLP